MAAALAYPLLAVAFVSLLVACVSPKLWISRLNFPGAAFIASLSYVMYLVQKMVFNVCEMFFSRLGYNPHTYVGFATMMVVLIGVSFIVYSLVEKPFMKLRQKILRKNSRSATAI